MPLSNNVRKVTSENYPTDAGREGEAIFRRVYALAGSKLPIKRLWISSMEDAAIQQGFENLKDGAAYDNLFAASECRAKADWLIGMNGTRAFTKKYGRKQTIGRVQTPTLAMLAERQAKIQNFVKEPYAQKKLEQEQPFVKQFYVVENLQAAPLKIERFGNLDDAMSQYQALPNHYMKALGVEKNPDPLPGSLDVLQCRNGIDTIVEDYKTVPGWDNPYIQNHVVQPLQGALAVQDVELAYELPDAYFHIQTCDDGFDYTLYNKDFTERDGGVLETDGDKSVQEAMTELPAAFSCDAAESKVMDAAELREQADTVAEQQAEVLKEKLAAERPVPEETLSFYVAECLEFTFAGEFHDHLTMEEALEAYDKIPSERMNADKCIGFCIEEDGGFVGMYELVVNDKVQRENINSINYFRDDKLVQQAISDMEKLMAARQQSKEQERGSTKKSVLDALRSLKAKKQEQPAQEQDKPKKAKKKGMEL